MSVEELQALFLSGQKPKSERLRTLEWYFPYFDRELKKTGVTQQLLWEEYKTRHPDGFMLTQFKYWYREWCKQLAPVMHFDHKAGDKLFVDYTGKKLHWVEEHSGEVKEAEVFVSVLGSSQMTYVEASNSQQKEDFISSIENALWFYGGVPRGIVTDNLKAAVTQSSRYEPTLNETFADFAEHYETTARRPPFFPLGLTSLEIKPSWRTQCASSIIVCLLRSGIQPFILLLRSITPLLNY